jgi:hypothetical protein
MDCNDFSKQSIAADVAIKPFTHSQKFSRIVPWLHWPISKLALILASSLIVN